MTMSSEITTASASKLVATYLILTGTSATFISQTGDIQLVTHAIIQAEDLLPPKSLPI